VNFGDACVDFQEAGLTGGGLMTAARGEAALASLALASEWDPIRLAVLFVRLFTTRSRVFAGIGGPES
jgi:hypothetical protein